MLYNIYDKEKEEYLKFGCTFITVIPENYGPTDEEVRDWFNIDEDNRWWEFNHRPFKVRRLVFDKLIIPDIPRYVMRPCEGE